MKAMHQQKEYEQQTRPFPVSVALLFIIAGINIVATALSFLAALQG
ncbi:hypothetical protein [Microvirga sp. CF3016]|nr:hypothetical protein [Microvirga sp. CF3016]MEE1613828.1 hypothetical protein [Microvirga sp. CF3016]